MVSQHGNLLSYQLVSIVCKDPLTGRTYSPFRAIASRKTTAVRIIMFNAFFGTLKNSSLHHPLQANRLERLTLATDFETTFAKCTGNVLANIFRPYSDLAYTSDWYIEKGCFGCGVYAKKIIMEKFHRQCDKMLFLWLVGTSTSEVAEEVSLPLDKMTTINVQLGNFARWLCKSKVANILRFLEALQNHYFWSIPSAPFEHKYQRSGTFRPERTIWLPFDEMKVHQSM